MRSQARCPLACNTPDSGCGARTAAFIWLQRTSICSKASAEAGYLDMPYHSCILHAVRKPHSSRDPAEPYLGRYCEMSSTHLNRTAVLQMAGQRVSGSLLLASTVPCLYNSTCPPQWLRSCPVHEGQEDCISSSDTGEKGLHKSAAASEGYRTW